ncbi:hypothetical protein GDO78_004701 [Eleutherodactylus coqui]|uniref:Uncharacterized protein n=1 Tax=Eleutherodactylus coqui TaxID=57060 RepID=A0A8J6ET61_ELECQ|nr:hypothetical protein GDO78_004701 [Eleutherodactylus coqui]
MSSVINFSLSSGACFSILELLSAVISSFFSSGLLLSFPALVVTSSCCGASPGWTSVTTFPSSRTPGRSTPGPSPSPFLSRPPPVSG